MTHLYRIWSGDLLLYVGISKSFLKRFSEHMVDQPWADEITNVSCDVYPTRKEAIEAEKKTIEDEKPKYNKLLQKKEKPVVIAQRQWAEATLEDRQKSLDIIRKLVGVRFDEETQKNENLIGLASRMLLLTSANDAAITFAPP
jgi:predicted GIY-YIG superfamily endonuclease